MRSNVNVDPECRRSRRKERLRSGEEGEDVVKEEIGPQHLEGT